MTRSTQRAAPPLEHRILMTATLCLMAFGAVMVYSASSPLGVLSGKGGTGTGEFFRYLIFGALGPRRLFTDLTTRSGDHGPPGGKEGAGSVPSPPLLAARESRESRARQRGAALPLRQVRQESAGRGCLDHLQDLDRETVPVLCR